MDRPEGKRRPEINSSQSLDPKRKEVLARLRNVQETNQRKDTKIFDLKQYNEIEQSDILKKLEETLQKWNNNVNDTLQNNNLEENKKYPIYCEIQGNKLKIYSDNKRPLFFSLDEKEKIECFCDFLQNKEVIQAVKTIREGASYDWFPIDKDTQLCIDQLDKTLQDWNKHVDKSLQEHNQSDSPVKYHLEFKIQKYELEFYNDNKHLFSLPSEKVYIECFDNYLQKLKNRPNMEETIKEVEKIGLSASIEKTLQDWNKHVDETLQKHNQSETPDNYRLYYKRQENTLDIYKVNKEYLFSLPLEKGYIEHFDSYLQIMKERFSIHETIKKLDKIGLSDSIEQLEDTLQDWNGHDISNKYPLSIKYPDNQAIEILKDKEELVLSLPLEKEKIEQFNSMLQEWNHHANQHENLITRSKINEKDLDIQAHRANLKFCRDRFFYSLQEPSTAKEWIDELAMDNKQFKDFLDKRNTTHKEDTVKTKSHLRAISSASSLKKFFYKYFAGRTDEFKKRAAFDKLYKDAHSKSQEATNDPNRRQGLDRTNNADTDVHSDAKKLRSQEIITKLKGAIKKFNRDIESLEETRKRIQQKLNENCENYKRNITQSIEEHEMQRRQEFGHDYNARLHALQQERHEELKRCQEWNQCEFKFEESRSEEQRRHKFNQYYKNSLDDLEKEKCKEIEKQNYFNQCKEEIIHNKLYELIIKEKEPFEQWYIYKYRQTFSEFKKEIEHFKMAEDYRRYRKESKFGAH